MKQKETPMWQAVDVEDDTSTPPWAQPWTASKEKEETFNAINEDPRNADSCVIEMENPSTSYLHERPSRAANRYGSPFRSPNMGGTSRRPAYSYEVEERNKYEFDALKDAKAMPGRGSGRGDFMSPSPERQVGGTFVPTAPSMAPSPIAGRHDHGQLARYEDDQRNPPPGVPLHNGGGPRQSRDLQQAKGDPPKRAKNTSSASGLQQQRSQRSRNIGLNPLQENPTLRLLAYEACLRLCFSSALSAAGAGADPSASGSSGPSEAKIFLENGFQLLQSSFGVDKMILEPLSKQSRKGAGVIPSNEPRDLGRQQQVNTTICLNLMFTGMKSIGKANKKHVSEGSSSETSFLHSIGKRLRPSSKGKSLYYHLRLSSKIDGEYHITKVGSQNLVSLEIFSSERTPSEGQNRYSAEDVLEIILKDKQDVSIGRATMPISSTIDTEVHGRTQLHNLPVRSQQGNIIGSLAMTTTIEKKVSRKKDDVGVEDDLKSNEWEFDAKRAYDVLLQVALAANNFKQRHLLITKAWQFLLNKFASEYNISTTTCILQFLKWVVRAATPTSECMDILCQLLPRIMKERHQADLPVAEQNMLSQIMQNVEELLAKAFQCIKSLSEKESNGVLTGNQMVPKDVFPSPVIPKVLFLYSQMHDLLAPSSQKKLIMHLQAAANLRFGRIKRDAIDSCTGEQRIVGEGIDCLAASKIFDALRVELEYDQILHHSEALPAFVNFPDISNEVYAEKLYEHLKELLVTNPPTDFSDALDSLFRSASLYETAQSKFSLNSPKDKSVFVLFSDHVETWIRRDCTWLCAKLTQKEVSQEVVDIERALGNYHFSGQMDSHLPHQSPHQLYMIPLFKKSGGVFEKIQAFLSKYSGIVKRWPDWVPVLETSCCKILRSLLCSLNEASTKAGSHNGSNQHKHTPVKMLRCKKAAHFATRLSITDAVLLNAQRQMLSFIPKLRSSVSVLTSGVQTQKDASSVFKDGTMFRHVEEEVRTSYAQTIQRFVISLSEAPCHKLKKILKEQSKAKLNDCEQDNVKDLLKPYLTMIESVLADHRVMLTPKVWRDLCRGMWDLAAAEVLKFVERIHNDKENATAGGFKVRVMTSEVSAILENFFQAGIHQVLGSDVHERDLQTPFSAKKLRERICGNNQSVSASDSFSVY